MGYVENWSLCDMWTFLKPGKITGIFQTTIPNLDGFTSISAWKSNHIPSKAWDENIYSFQNFKSCTIED